MAISETEKAEIYQQGVKAANSGAFSDSCPHRDEVHRLLWLDGYNSAWVELIKRASGAKDAHNT